METKEKPRTTLMKQVKKANKLINNITTKTFVYDHSAKRYMIDFHNEFIDKWSAQLKRNKSKKIKKVTPSQHKRIVNALVKKYSTKIDDSYRRLNEWKQYGAGMKQQTISLTYETDKNGNLKRTSTKNLK